LFASILISFGFISFCRIGRRILECTNLPWVPMDPRYWLDTVSFISRRMESGRLHIITVVPCPKVCCRQQPRLSNWRNCSCDRKCNFYEGKYRYRIRARIGSEYIILSLECYFISAIHLFIYSITSFNEKIETDKNRHHFQYYCRKLFRSLYED
jgi:hypothetical protein